MLCDVITIQIWITGGHFRKSFCNKTLMAEPFYAFFLKVATEEHFSRLDCFFKEDLNNVYVGSSAPYSYFADFIMSPDSAAIDLNAFSPYLISFEAFSKQFT
jgi:hypothetical protein